MGKYVRVKSLRSAARADLGALGQMGQIGAVCKALVPEFHRDLCSATISFCAYLF